MRIIKATYLFIFCLLISYQVSFSQNSATCLGHKNIYKAGDVIELIINSDSTDQDNNLILSSSYGTTVIKASNNKFKIPLFIARKSGIVSYSYSSNSDSCNGQFTIQPLGEADDMETYVGPPSIVVGGKDFTMVSVIPNDIYNNPLADDTEIETTNYVSSQLEQKVLPIRNLVVYDRIFSPNKSGKLFVASKYLETHSKEFEVQVVPSNPESFQIAYEMLHNYADGNQKVQLKTDLITDEFDNIVADGTLVYFKISTNDNSFLFSQGKTINGYCNAFIRHPFTKQNWSVKGYVEGIAESNEITITFEDAVKSIDPIQSFEDRILRLGPVYSFMNQFMPNGYPGTLTLTDQKGNSYELNSTIKDGYFLFDLPKDIFNQSSYEYLLKCGNTTIEGILEP